MTEANWNRWWVIHDQDLAQALQRVAEGDDPWVVHTELFANSRIENPEESDE
jgi:hypothetical protein